MHTHTHKCTCKHTYTVTHDMRMKKKDRIITFIEHTRQLVIDILHTFQHELRVDGGVHW